MAFIIREAAQRNLPSVHPRCRQWSTLPFLLLAVGLALGWLALQPGVVLAGNIGSGNCTFADLQTEVASGVVNFTADCTITMTDQITVTNDVTFTGNGFDVILQGDGDNRLFDITGDAGGRTVIFDGIVLQDGRMPNVAIGNNEGGALAVRSATHTGAGVTTLQIRNSLLRNNSTDEGNGGAIFLSKNLTGALPNLIIQNSTVTNNTAGDSSAANGGGIYCGLCTATITNTTISTNTANGIQGGGGFFVSGDDSNVRLTNSTLSGNTANRGAGFATPTFSTTLTISLTHVTIAANSGTGFTHNADSGTVNAVNTLVTDNSAGTAGVLIDGLNSANSVVANTTGLGPLADNGGDTQTHALSTASANAVNQGLDTGSLSTDQRGSGFARKVGAGVDIGALELQTLDNDVVIVKAIEPTGPLLPGQPISYTMQFSNSGVVPATGVVIADPIAGIVPVPLSGLQIVSSTFGSSVAITETGTAPTLAWSVSDLAQNSGGVITVTGQISPSLGAGTSFTNTVFITSTADISTTNNRATAAAIVLLPTVSFSVANFGVGEDTGSATITVTVTPANPFADVRVGYSSSDGSAQAGTDYTGVNSTLVISAGQASATFVVPLNADSTVEADETLNLDLTSAVGGSLAGITTATLTLNNDDSTTLTLASVNTTRDENAGGATTDLTWRATLGNPVQGGFEVAFATTDGTATLADNDYIDNDSVLVFSGTANESADIVVQVNGDSQVEADETLQVALGALTDLAAGVDSADIAIVDSSQNGLIVNDDVALALVTGDADKAEGDSGVTGFTFVVSRTGDISGATTVDYVVSGQGADPATGDDFADGVFPGGQVTFASGEVSQTITVAVQGDTTIEQDEGFQVTLSNASGGAQITTGSATGIIRNDDSTPLTTLAVAAGDADKAEGDSGSTGFTFVVTRSGDFSSATTVDYASSGQGADPATADDFDGGTLPAGQVIFAGGEVSQTITVAVQGDTGVEPDEGFRVTLSNASGGAQITTGSATGVIRNDDTMEPTTLAVAAGDADKTEGDSGATEFTFVVSRNGDTSGATSVEYAVSGQGTDPATADDFAGSVFPAGQVSFSTGESSKIITASIQGDTAVEPDEGFQVMLSNASGSAQITTATANGIIRNDDSVSSTTVAIAVENADKPEGDSGVMAFTFIVWRDGDPSGTTTVDYTASGQGADPATADDFAGSVFPAGQVSFSTGESSKIITASIQGDTGVEPDENFQITLSNASGGAQITAGSAVGVIRNDDNAMLTTLAIAAEDADRGEGDSGVTPFLFVISRSGDASGVTTVDFGVFGQGAAGVVGSDFEGGIFPNGQVTFASGEISQTITVNVQGDANVEPDERFRVTLSNAPGGVLITTGSATGVIRNDDSSSPTTLAVAVENADKAEGNSGATVFTFIVSRGGTIGGATSVDYVVSGQGIAPAEPSDFETGSFATGQVAFASGEVSKTILVAVQGDVEPEPDERFRVTLFNASAGAQISTGSATGIIRNDDSSSPTTLAIVPGDADKAEGDSGVTPFFFVVSRSGDNSGVTTVNYVVSGLGATLAEPSDFENGAFAVNQVIFASGEVNKTIPVNVQGDTDREPDEGFQVTLSNASGGAQITTGSAAGIIRNDDPFILFLPLISGMGTGF